MSDAPLTPSEVREKIRDAAISHVGIGPIEEMDNVHSADRASALMADTGHLLEPCFETKLIGLLSLTEQRMILERRYGSMTPVGSPKRGDFLIIGNEAETSYLGVIKSVAGTLITAISSLDEQRTVDFVQDDHLWLIAYVPIVWD